jgi:hypothetical protein
MYVCLGEYVHSFIKKRNTVHPRVVMGFGHAQI